MTTLTEFLLARIAEDEAVAEAATAGPWKADGGVMYSNGKPPYDVTGENDLLGADWMSDNDASHIARHDPARVLAECEAKRRVLEEHRIAWDSQACQVCKGADAHTNGCAPADAGWWACATCDSQHIEGEYGQESPTAGGCTTLRLLSLPYADHPDYDETWRP